MVDNSAQQKRRQQEKAFQRQKEIERQDYYEQLKRISEDAQFLVNSSPKKRTPKQVGNFSDIFSSTYETFVHCLKIEGEISGALGHLDIETRANIESSLGDLTPEIEFLLENFLVINDERKRLLKEQGGIFSKLFSKKTPNVELQSKIQAPKIEMSKLNQELLSYKKNLESMKQTYQETLEQNSDLIKQEGVLRNEVLDFKRKNRTLKTTISDITLEAEKNISELVKQTSLAEQYSIKLEENRKSHQSRKGQVIGLTLELSKYQKKSNRDSKSILGLTDSLISLFEDYTSSQSDLSSSISPSDFLYLLSENLGLGLSLERRKNGNLSGELGVKTDENTQLTLKVQDLESKILDLSNLETNFSSLNEERTKLSSKLSDKNLTIEDLNSQIIDLENRLETSQDLSTQSKSDLQSQLDSLRSQISSYESSCDKLNSQLAGLNSEVLVYQTQIESLSKELNSSQSDLSSSISRSDFLYLLSENLGLGLSLECEKSADLSGENSQLESQLSVSKCNLESKISELSKKKSTIVDLTSQIIDFKDRLETSQDLSTQRKSDLQSQITLLESQVSGYQTQIDGLTSDLSSSLSRSETSQDLSENLGLGLSLERKKSDDLSDKNTQLETDLSVSKSDLESKISELSNLETNFSSLNEDRTKLSSKLSNKTSIIEDLTSQIVDLENRLETSQDLSSQSESDLKSQLKILTSQISGYETSCDKLNSQLSELNSEVLVYQTQIDGLTSDLSSSLSRSETSQDLSENLGLGLSLERKKTEGLSCELGVKSNENTKLTLKVQDLEKRLLDSKEKKESIFEDEECFEPQVLKKNKKSINFNYSSILKTTAKVISTGLIIGGALIASLEGTQLYKSNQPTEHRIVKLMQTGDIVSYAKDLKSFYFKNSK